MMQNSSALIENILENCLTAMEEEGQTVDECLARFSQQREELGPLLNLSLRLQTGSLVTAPPQFRQAAAVRMQNLIAARPRPFVAREPAPRPQAATHRVPHFAGLLATLRQRRAALAFTTLLLVLFILTGNSIVYAANRSLPGETLYPLKTVLERSRLALSISEPGDASLHLDFAGQRLAEARGLVELAQSDRAAEPLANYDLEVQQVLAPLEAQGRLTSEEEAVLAERILSQLDRWEVDLLHLQGQLPAQSPAQVQARVARALERTQTALARARQILERRPGLAVTLPVLPGITAPGATPQPSGTPRPALAPGQTQSTTATITPTVVPTGWVEGEWQGQRTAVPEKWRTRFPGELPGSLPTVQRTPQPPAWPTSWPTEQWPTAWPTGKWPDGWPTQSPDKQPAPDRTPAIPPRSTARPILQRTPAPRTPFGNWPSGWPTP